MIGGAYFRNVTVLFVITKLVPFKIHLDPSTTGLKIGHIEPVVNFRVLQHAIALLIAFWIKIRTPGSARIPLYVSLWIIHAIARCSVSRGKVLLHVNPMRQTVQISQFTLPFTLLQLILIGSKSAVCLSIEESIAEVLDNGKTLLALTCAHSLAVMLLLFIYLFPTHKQLQ